MEPSSPPTDRVLRIVQLLADRPFEAFSLSDLVRLLGINRATGHAIVSTMLEGGHLVRHPQTKTYSLGPTWIAVGRAAEQARPEIAHAFAEIERLATRCGAPCSISLIVGDAIVSLGSRGRAIGETTLPAIGQRIPFVPPYGSSALVDAPEEALEAWLARAPAETPASELDRFRQRVEQVRARGYGVERLTDTEARLRQILVELQASALDGGLEDQVGRLAHELHLREGPFRSEGAQAAPVSEIYAPVAGTGLTLSLHFEQRPLTASEIDRYAKLLRASCDRIANESPRQAANA